MWGGGGGYAARLFLLFSLPCSADHERDWPPCEVVFFGLATNTLKNVRNNNRFFFKQQQMVYYIVSGLLLMFFLVSLHGD